MPRAMCPQCQVRVPLTKAGTFRKHKGWYGQMRKICPGSGKPPPAE